MYEREQGVCAANKFVKYELSRVEHFQPRTLCLNFEGRKELLNKKKYNKNIGVVVAEYISMKFSNKQTLLLIRATKWTGYRSRHTEQSFI